MSRREPLPAAPWCLGQSELPPSLAADPKPPECIYGLGDQALLTDGLARVGIVGSRRCTSYGRDVARRFGRQLSSAGVTVVSGLAYGIDAAAHEGALQIDDGAPPVGVVASGLDVVYPRQHRRLWWDVAKRGCLISEAGLGVEPERWRFPERNRIIAGLADVVLVIEAHPQSGTRHTVDAAIERGVLVMAVPGPIDSRASQGANQLLREGCAPACDVDDVLTALGLERCGGGAPLDLRRPPAPADEPVLSALDWVPTGIDTLMRRTGLHPGAITTALYRLMADGWASCSDGRWQRLAPPGAD